MTEKERELYSMKIKNKSNMQHKVCKQIKKWRKEIKKKEEEEKQDK